MYGMTQFLQLILCVCMPTDLKHFGLPFGKMHSLSKWRWFCFKQLHNFTTDPCFSIPLYYIVASTIQQIYLLHLLLENLYKWLAIYYECNLQPTYLYSYLRNVTHHTPLVWNVINLLNMNDLPFYISTLAKLLTL